MKKTREPSAEMPAKVFGSAATSVLSAVAVGVERTAGLEEDGPAVFGRGDVSRSPVSKGPPSGSVEISSAAAEPASRS